MRRSLPLLQLLTLAVMDKTISSPLKGVRWCLNHEDCLGAHRVCHRNASMTDGECVCQSGFRPAAADVIRCLHIEHLECVTQTDCENLNLTCLPIVSEVVLMRAETQRRCVDMTRREFDTHVAVMRELFRFDHMRSQSMVVDKLMKDENGHESDYSVFKNGLLLGSAIILLGIVLVVLLATRDRWWRPKGTCEMGTGRPQQYVVGRDPPPYCGQDGGRNASSVVTTTVHVDNDEDAVVAIRHEGNRRRLRNTRDNQTPPPTYDESVFNHNNAPLVVAVPAEYNHNDNNDNNGNNIGNSHGNSHGNAGDESSRDRRSRRVGASGSLTAVHVLRTHSLPTEETSCITVPSNSTERRSTRLTQTSTNTQPTRVHVNVCI